MRLLDKTAVVVGAGQTAGETVGNGRATAIVFAREGAKLLLVDRDEQSLEETRSMIEAEGFPCTTLVADVTSESDCRGIVETCTTRLGRLDILHNNVGTGVGDRGVVSFDSDAWDRIMAINVKSMAWTCKYALPVMRGQRAGSIVNISSIAAVVTSQNLIAYRVSKAGVNALTQAIAISGAGYGIRANVIMPGLLDTPIAIEGYQRERGIDRDELIAARNAQVPLNQLMGTAWDVAYAALFLASDEAKFVTGVILPVDGGQTARVG